MIDHPTGSFAHFNKICVGYNGKMVFDDLNLQLPAQKITAFCGPNGCGKSTALKTLRRHLQPKSGAVFVHAEPIQGLKDKDLAKRMAMLSQSPSAPEELSVEQLVSLGRFANRKTFGGLSDEDHSAISRAITACDLVGLSTRTVGELSGGQLQRTWIAMVLAQDAPAILLDEPTNHLDLTHQLDTMELVKALNVEENKTIIFVSHDINLAARYAHEMVLFKAGKVITQGTPAEVMKSETIDAIFDINSQINLDPVHQTPFCFAYPAK